MTTWKAVERAIAQRLGGQRVPITGRQRGSAPDVAHEEFGIEVKHRKALPSWLLDAMDQAVACSGDGAKLPVVVLHQAGQRHDNDLIVLRLKDFEEIES